MDAVRAGARFGRYEIVRGLGRGGTAEVFEARHIDLHKRVALKIAHPLLVPDERAIERVLREGRAATAINHPHVVDVVDVGVESHRPYLVMELLDGEDLASHLSRNCPLSVEDTVGIMLPVLSGVSAVHRAGIVHRDLKPSNILLARRFGGIEPVVVDFGISHASDAPPNPSTSSTRGAGTLPYMAPEQVRGLRDVTPSCDQYALGVILYECVTGGTPFWSDDRYELMRGIMTDPIVPPSHLNTEVPSSFDAVILRALARDPNARFGSVHALGEALWGFADAARRARWRAEFTPETMPELAGATAPPTAYAPTAFGTAGRPRDAWTFGIPLAAIGCGAAVCLCLAGLRVTSDVESSRPTTAPPGVMPATTQPKESAPTASEPQILPKSPDSPPTLASTEPAPRPPGPPAMVSLGKPSRATHATIRAQEQPAPPNEPKPIDPLDIR